MLLLQLDYKVKPEYAKKFYQKMFGSIYSPPKKRNKMRKYIPGFLDDVPYFKPTKNRILIKGTKKLDFEEFMKYCDKFDLKMVERENKMINLATGKERAKFFAEEKSIDLEI